MTQAVLDTTTETLRQALIAHYETHRKETPPHAVFCARYHGTTITIYQSGKVLFQGAHATEEAARWQEAAPTTKTATATSPTASAATPQSAASALPANFHQWAIIGSDEAGTGSYFGALTVCAAFASREQLAWMRELGVKDSKQFSDAQIAQLAETLRNTLPHVLLVVSPPKYNDIQPTMSQAKMKAILHNHAIAKLLQQLGATEPEAILIDQFEPPRTYFKHIADEPQRIRDRVYFATKGEQHHLAVAAASIIARDAFVTSLATLSKQAGCTLPSGAGANVDQVAAKLLRQHGDQALRQYAKYHFANTAKARKGV